MQTLGAGRSGLPLDERGIQIDSEQLSPAFRINCQPRRLKIESAQSLSHHNDYFTLDFLGLFATWNHVLKCDLYEAKPITYISSLKVCVILCIFL